MKNIIYIWLLFGLTLISSVVFCQATDVYSFESNRQQAQFHHLLGDLRCLVCQNQDLATSTAPLAKDLRDEVYKFVRNGRSDDEIIHFLTQRYGDFVLFKPPMKGLTWILWLGPLFFLIIGIILFFNTYLHKGRNV